MESWIPLMNIFMNSPSPETQALFFLQSSKTNISTSSFLSLLIKPTNSRFIWLQTLPNVVQARILSFLVYNHHKFNKQDLSKLATHFLSNNNKTKIDFWVKKAARQLFDLVSDSNYKWVSCFNLDSQEDDDDKFDEDIGGGVLPEWLKDVVATNENEIVFPWIPVSVDEVNTRIPDVLFEEDDDDDDDDDDGDDEMMVEVEEGEEEDGNRDVEMVHLDRETEEKAALLKMKILNLESHLLVAELVDDIRKLCVEKKGNSLKVLGLIEPWNADDEIVPVMLSGLLDGNKEEDFVLTSNIVCSVLLPKFLNLEKPASRVLVTATIDYSKVHYKAVVYALLFPLILHKDGINSFICDVITKIVKECLHPAHVSAFCQKLLCEEKAYICLPCHKHLVSEELVWTESLFNLFQNILNHNVHLTQDSVDVLVFHIQESATTFSKSLKFANFLLCFVTKCAPLLKIHKTELSEAVGNTTSFLTKSILSKLASI